MLQKQMNVSVSAIVIVEKIVKVLICILLEVNQIMVKSVPPAAVALPKTKNC